MKHLLRSTKKKQMALGLEVNVIGISTKKIFFLNIEKSCVVQNQIRKILIGNIEPNNQKHANIKIYLYYKNLFSERRH